MLVRLRWLVVLLWAAAAVWAYVYLPPLDEETTGRVSDLVPFGVGTDYTLFLLSRTRRALREGAAGPEAARLGVEGVGGVLLSSAVVLIAAFALLVFAQMGMYTALGPGLAIALTLVFVVTLTLVPALLAILGRTAFGGASASEVERTEDTSPGPLLRRPGLTAGVLCAVLVLCAAGAIGLRVGFDQVENLPDDSPLVAGYEALASGFPQGVLAPVNVLVSGERLDEGEVRRLGSELLGSGGYAAVIGLREEYLVPDVEFLSEDGTAARFLLVSYGPPYSPEAVTVALRRTGRTINAAGLALAASFALLALIPLQDFFQIGVAVALGILLDAFVIRTLLVPALVLLVGRTGFWPAKVRSS